jgi:uncharacterized membrane protein
MSNQTGAVIEGVFLAFLLYALMGLLVAKHAALSADTNCDTSCKGFNDFWIAVTFLGGSWGLAIAFGMVEPIRVGRGRRG